MLSPREDRIFGRKMHDKIMETRTESKRKDTLIFEDTKGIKMPKK